MKWFLIIDLVLALIVAAVLITGMLLPKDHVASRQAHLKQSPERVWALISGDQSWRPGVKYDPLPDRNGRRAWKETKGKDTITFETIESSEPRRMVTRIADPNLPFGGSWTYEIEPEPGGCMLQITENGEVYNPIFRFVSRFIMGHTATIDGYLSALEKRLAQTHAQGA